ncbi:hypothetical protein CkP1_0067 [Citrobacter phage CkP1]|nr:hypothetical protein CkP1_0067 [Citrobacter phage CkP1]
MQLHYPWIHEVLVHCYLYVEKMGEEFPALYTIACLSSS